MKKTKSLLFLIILLSIVISGCSSDQNVNTEKAEQEKLTIITSFYPVYLATVNVTKDIEGIVVKNMTKPQTGCLHDYQLTPEDVKTLEKADVFVINGAGMESFIEKVTSQQKELNIVDASRQIQLLSDKDEKNPHVWVSVSNAILQTKNIAAKLSEIDPAHAEQYKNNADTYIAKLEKLRAEMHEAIDPLPNKNIVTFHEAFPYFAQEFNLNIIDVIEREPGSEPSPKELEETINKVKALNVKALFAEPQYPSGAAKTIANESGSKIYILDPIVTGTADSKDYDAYINIMKKNMQVLKEALQ